MKNDSECVAAHVDQERLGKGIMDMIDVPSPIGGELALAEFLAEHFKAMGLNSWLQEVEPNRPNVVGVLEGEGGGPTLMFLGHMDTTWTGQEEGIRDLGPAYQPRAYRDGDWIYGMGAYNMKSGFASTIEAVQAIVDSGVRLKGNIIIAGVCGETCNAQVGRFQGARYRGSGVGCRFLVTNGVTADLCVVPEPTNGRISAVNGGYVLLEITTKGHPAATYVRGAAGVEVKPAVDAIDKMNSVVGAIRAWQPSYMETHRYNGELATQVAVVAIEGGLPYRASKQAAICKLTLEIGIMPYQHPLDVIEEVRSLLRSQQARDSELEADLNVVQAVPGSVVSPDEYLVTGLAAAHRTEYGEEPPITFDSWLADTTHLTRYGIPAVCYGPAGRMRAGGAGYYAKEGEQCFLPDIVRGARVMARFAVDTCSRSRTELKAQIPASRGTVVI
ncbi:MAG: M20/M25/M40 family metallo-hydrolase [Ardenticatenaceae bacterium]|nr:M20/M25/M40 family metallo-hydrolase [Ardenticatenaceae bacterium]